MMLRYSFDMAREADDIEKAVGAVLDQGLRTADMMSEGMIPVGTKEMGAAIARTSKYRGNSLYFFLANNII